MGMKKKTISAREIRRLWPRIKAAHARHLAKLGVKLPGLERDGKLNRTATVLAILFKYKGQAVTKAELTELVRKVHKTAGDVQQARHLGAQYGWNITTGTRGDSALPLGAYSLEDTRSSLPTYRRHREGKLTPQEWENLKREYDGRCASCGALPGNRPLTRAHMDPTKDFDVGNTIPQCEPCNKVYQDKFVFGADGRVRDINIQSRWWKRRLREICS